MNQALYIKIFIGIKILFFTALKKITKRKFIVDATGTILTPGGGGKNCKGNGMHLNWRGKTITCCCDECDYMMCCFEGQHAKMCADCDDRTCPLSGEVK